MVQSLKQCPVFLVDAFRLFIKPFLRFCDLHGYWGLLIMLVNFSQSIQVSVRKYDGEGRVEYFEFYSSVYSLFM
jgi:hypothetical protein